MEEFERRIESAQGYSELGMHKEALEQLDAIPVEIADNPEVLETRVAILMRTQRWKDAFLVSKRLCKAAPDLPLGFIHAAFCLHELGRTDEAKLTLLNGPVGLRDDPIFHYNLACYECVLGDIEAAKLHLQRSFSLDKRFREFAKTDPDLSPLRKTG